MAVDLAAQVRELLFKVRLAEDSGFEFKRVEFAGDKVRTPHRDSLADELAAFANAGGGTVVLGVEDRAAADGQRTVSGIAPDKLDGLESWVVNLAQDAIDPPLLALRTLALELPDRAGIQRAVLRIDVPRSLFVHRSPGGYRLRVGSSQREMAPDYLARLFQQRSQARLIRFDEQPVPDTAAADLDPALYRRFLGPLDEPEAVKLRKLHLLTAQDGSDRLSVAAVLLCTPAPQHWLRSAYVQAVAYRGTVNDAAQQLDALDCTGPLDEQIRQALRFVQRNQRVPARKDLGREDLAPYSLRAVFEAVVNAVAHRDYAIWGAKIRLQMFADRLELMSPGALPNTLDVDGMALRQSTRNELVASLLARCPTGLDAAGRARIMDIRGEGVPLILRESTALSGRRPHYRLVGEELHLTIWAARPAPEPDFGHGRRSRAGDLRRLDAGVPDADAEARDVDGDAAEGREDV